MDSRDETKIRQREEQLARRVGEALDQATPNSARECPDAEILAAYAEQALGPQESSQWEGHFATCARCRTVLGVLTASAETPLAEKEVARLGQLVSPVEIREKSSERVRPRLLDWHTRWLAPALGMAAVLAVWFAMRPPWPAPDQAATGTLVAQAPKDELPLDSAPAAENRVSSDALQRDQKTANAPPASRLSTESQAFNAPSGTPTKNRADAADALDRVSPSSSSRMSSVQEEKKLRVPAEERQTQVPAAPPSPAESAKEKAAMAAPAPEPQSQAKVASNAVPSAAAPQMEKDDAKRGADASLRDKQQATAQAPEASRSRVAGAISSEMQNSPRNEQTFDVLRAAQPYSALLKTPSGSTLWRAGKGGVIERSTDAGKTWFPQASPSREDWLAGAAASDTVCWLVGRNGAIALTMDGTHWLRVAPPAQAAPAGAKSQDFISVTANDAQSAVITAGDGRRFATPNGGKTWQSQ